MDDENEPLRIALEDTKFTLSLRDAALLVARESAAINAESARVAWQTAQRLEDQVEQLRAVTRKLVANERLFYGDGDCIYCGAYYGPDMDPPYPHTPDCPVVYARQLLGIPTPKRHQ
jgi:hypothetical protein